MRKSNIKILVAAAFAVVVLFGAVNSALATENTTKDPMFTLINGSTSVFTDSAVYEPDGSVKLSLTASNGYGTRANMSALGAAGLLNVKDFSTKFSMNVPVNMSTVFSLQTDPSGTIGPNSGNGVQVLLRKDTEGKLTVAVYDQSGQTTYYASADVITLNAENEVEVKFTYTENAVITVSSGTSTVNVSNLKALFDSHYKEEDYKGYWSLSAYYMSSVTTANVEYVVREINARTPKAHETALLSDAISALENGIAGLDENSTSEEITEVLELNVFKDGIWSELLEACDADGALGERLNDIYEEFVIYEQRIDFEVISAQLTAFSEKLANYVPENVLSVKAARNAYYAIDLKKLSVMGEPYRNQLDTMLADIRAEAKYSDFIRAEGERFLSGYEALIHAGDAVSLRAYREILELPTLWSAFVVDNGLDTCLTEAERALLSARAEGLKQSVENSFYTTLWTEGDTWNAELREQGLYVSGEGKYGEALGFNQKLELGKNAEVTFNVIYALKRLGSNHLHIGFYPKTNTATLGDSDGVRVDFWFAGSSIEVKPVNGKTELPLYDSAYITIPDTGFFDVDTPDYEEGKYTVKLNRNGNTLVLTVNGLEMSLVGLNADLYDNGCYLTLSAMSVRGADYNELLVTKVGDVNYVGYVHDPNAGNGPIVKPGTGCTGCGGNITAGHMAMLLHLAFAALILKLSFKSNLEEKL